MNLKGEWLMMLARLSKQWELKSCKPLVILCLLFLVVGCAGKPTVYVYGKYLGQQELGELSEVLQNNQFNVQVNQLDFPTSVSDNTLLYSLLLRDASSLTKLELVLAEQDIEIKRVQAMVEGNHWYNKDSVALFVMPDVKDQQVGVFKQDLVHLYQAEDSGLCGGELLLQLNKDGSYQFSGTGLDPEYKNDWQGSWHYRLYPYLELRPVGAKLSTQYFEIGQKTGRDKVSEIAFTLLKPVQSQLLPSKCSLVFGLRQ